MTNAEYKKHFPAGTPDGVPLTTGRNRAGSGCYLGFRAKRPNGQTDKQHLSNCFIITGMCPFEKWGCQMKEQKPDNKNVLEHAFSITELAEITGRDRKAIAATVRPPDPDAGQQQNPEILYGAHIVAGAEQSAGSGCQPDDPGRAAGTLAG